MQDIVPVISLCVGDVVCSEEFNLRVMTG